VQKRNLRTCDDRGTGPVETSLEELERWLGLKKKSSFFL
jgi:hypothetical protein